jgi:hypothetical protein
VTGGADGCVMIRMIGRYLGFSWAQIDTAGVVRGVAAQNCTISMPCCGQKRTSERVRKSEEAAPALEKVVRMRELCTCAFHTPGRACDVEVVVQWLLEGASLENHEKVG